MNFDKPVDSLTRLSKFYSLLETERTNLKYSEHCEYDLNTVHYNTIFDNKVVDILDQVDVKQKLDIYIKKYLTLIEQSPYLNKKFHHYNAIDLGKKLDKVGFFSDNKHLIILNAKDTNTIKKIDGEKQFFELIEAEIKRIMAELDKEWMALDEELNRKAESRKFREHISEHPELIPKLQDLTELRKNMWKCYFKIELSSLDDFLQSYSDIQLHIQQIVKKSMDERNKWENVLKKFKARFHVPFTINIINTSGIILGGDEVHLKFSFNQDGQEKEITQKDLADVLSNGELRAFYILDALFQIEGKMDDDDPTIVIIDDIADSFDYKNKFAIIQYLKQISEKNFYLIILTHNYDFFRSLCLQKVVNESECYFISKTCDKVELKKVISKDLIINPFNYLKNNIDSENKLIAMIPFVRNIIEYMFNTKKDTYEKLTKLLHFRSETSQITVYDLSTVIKNSLENVEIKFNINSLNSNKVLDIIHGISSKIIKETIEIDLYDKTVLAIGIRLKAEQLIKEKCEVDLDKKMEFWDVVKEYKKCSDDYEDRDKVDEAKKVFDRVSLMASDSIHLNAFMYESIIDMGSDELKTLYRDVSQLHL